MTTLADRFEMVRRHFGGLSQREMAERLGISKNTWQRYENGDSPNASVLSSLADLGIDVSWLLTGNGSMVRSESGTNQIHSGFGELKPGNISLDESDAEGFVLIPRYDVRAAAGGGSYVQEETLSGSLAFRREFLHQTLHANPSDLIVIEAKGDSMSGEIEDGDILLLDTSEPKLRGNGIYVFLVDGLLLVKNLRVRLDSAIEVYGANTETMPPTETILRKDLGLVRIVGRVIWRASKA